MSTNRGFLRHYFWPVQQCTGFHFWAENKLYRESGIGYVLADDSPGALIDFVENLDVSELDELKHKLLTMPVTDFATGPADTAALLEAIEKPRHKGHRP